MTDNLLVSAPGKVRVQALDLIRGMSILGVLAVNADGFAAPQAASLKPLTWPFPNEGWTAWSYWLMDTFFHDKFLTLFSMLFGVSLFLVGGDRSDRRKGRMLARRLAILFCFGIIHGFGIWWGDILSLYAATGGIMFFCRSWRPRTLLAIGIALYSVMALRQIPLTATPFSSPDARAAASASLVPDPAVLEIRRKRIAIDMANAKASAIEAYRLNERQYVRVLSGDLWLIPQTLALMMIGLSLFKFGFLAGKSGTPRYAVAILIGAIALVASGLVCWSQDVLEKPYQTSAALLLLLGPIVALGYAAVLILLLRTRASSALSPLAAAGRMAFTNYISQSVLMTSLFYGGRGEMMGEIDRPGLWAITLAVWALQLTWSPIWLRRYEMGPLEWVWRCLTVGYLVPFRKPA